MRAADLRKNSILCVCLFAWILAGAGPLHAQAKQPVAEKLKFVLVLTRHGVRSPTWTNERLDEYAKMPWPKWDVAPGLLTPHGKTLMTEFGSYYRELFASEGLLANGGCSDAGRIYIDTDSDERTIETGRGLADGMMPGCGLEVHSLGEGVQDPLFHSAGKVGKPDTDLALAAVAGRMGNAPEALLPAYQMQLESMQQVLSDCASLPCQAGAGKKSLLEIPAILTSGKGEHSAELKGPLNTGGTFAENFQLEYLEGMPAAQVGWGRVDEAKVRELMAIHAASSDLLQRTPYIARTQASNLLDHILRTLEQAQSQKKISGAIGDENAKAVFLVGHDTNLSNIAALLDAHWLIDGYQRDDAAPGGALVFELWSASDGKDGGKDFVRVSYTVQSPEQMRSASRLSIATPPPKAVIFLSGCSVALRGSPCAWTAFKKAATSEIDPDFVVP